MKKLVLLSTCALLTFTACTTTQSVKMFTNKTAEIYPTTIVQKPVVVDLEVKEKVTGTSSSNMLNVTIDIIKEQAINDALKKTNADILLDPQFETEIVGQNKTVTVRGYAATYKNFRPMQLADTLYVRTGASALLYAQNYTHKKEVSNYLAPKKKGSKVVVGVLGVLGGLVLLILIVVGLGG
ncbi:MAG: hypothetical protein H7331_01790 [Bacteroidia bacterium]|nr:hypothetical protein [Bacteroidia bacterium]